MCLFVYVCLNIPGEGFFLQMIVAIKYYKPHLNWYQKKKTRDWRDASGEKWAPQAF